MTEVGPYQLREPLGRGATATVFRAWDPRLQREVALKLFPPAPGSERSSKRFAREAEALARLSHPHVVRVQTVGEHQGQRYLVMDLVAGRSLAEVLASDGPLEPARAAAITAQLAEALEAAHAQHLLHRDLKPANVLLREDGSALLTDFGLAKDLAAPPSSLSQEGRFLGTPGYWPPEQARGGQDVGPAADVYGLGATLYAMLTGRAPIEGDNLANLIVATIEQVPVSPRQLNPRVPAALSKVCMRCLEKTPRRRYPSAQALGQALRGERGGAKRLLVGVGVCLALGATLAVALHQPPKPRVDPELRATPTPTPIPSTSAPDPADQVVASLLEGDFEAARAELSGLRGETKRALERALQLEQRRESVERRVDEGERELMGVLLPDADWAVTEIQTLLAETSRLSGPELGNARRELADRSLRIVARLMLIARDGMREVDDTRLSNALELAPGSTGAGMVGVVEALDGRTVRTRWAERQDPKALDPLPHHFALLRATLLLKEWRRRRPREAIEVGEAVLSRFQTERVAEVHFSDALREVRQDLAATHLRVASERYQRGTRQEAEPHVVAAYRHAFTSFSYDPLDPPPLAQANAELRVPEPGLEGFDHGALVSLFVSLVLSEQWTAARAVATAEQDVERSAVLLAELELLEGRPERALELLGQECDAYEEAWGIRVHANELLGRSEAASAATANMRSEPTRRIGIDWHARGSWFRDALWGQRWWPGVR